MVKIPAFQPRKLAPEWPALINFLEEVIKIVREIDARHASLEKKLEEGFRGLGLYDIAQVIRYSTIKDAGGKKHVSNEAEYLEEYALLHSKDRGTAEAYFKKMNRLSWAVFRLFPIVSPTGLVERTLRDIKWVPENLEDICLALQSAVLPFSIENMRSRHKNIRKAELALKNLDDFIKNNHFSFEDSTFPVIKDKELKKDLARRLEIGYLQDKRKLALKKVWERVEEEDITLFEVYCLFQEDMRKFIQNYKKYNREVGAFAQALEKYKQMQEQAGKTLQRRTEHGGKTVVISRKEK